MSVEVVDILLATYNGARFLREQLDSIVGHTYAHWRLLVRDDGSSDGTAAIPSSGGRGKLSHLEFINTPCASLYNLAKSTPITFPTNLTGSSGGLTGRPPKTRHSTRPRPKTSKTFFIASTAASQALKRSGE